MGSAEEAIKIIETGSVESETARVIETDIETIETGCDANVTEQELGEVKQEGEVSKNGPA
jgi:hypothetical protein